MKKSFVTGVVAAMGSAVGLAAGNVWTAVVLGLAFVAVTALRERGLTRREEIRRGIVRVGRHHVQLLPPPTKAAPGKPAPPGEQGEQGD